MLINTQRMIIAASLTPSDLNTFLDTDTTVPRRNKDISQTGMNHNAPEMLSGNENVDKVGVSGRVERTAKEAADIRRLRIVR